jgi:hypothetical protein
MGDNGVKLSAMKTPLWVVLFKQFPKAIEKVGQRSQFGHLKYLEHDADWLNYKRVPNGYEEYSNACMRHLLELGDEDSELEHHVATAWNSLARLQIYLENNELLENE